ncbi:MAG: flavodoxin family protein [Lachnospiraceae bacterium]|nr:flavodoxin family protein [Lachnospiraceae bacterium]
MILIINTTTDQEISRQVRAFIQDTGKEAEIIEAGKMNIHPCAGCNHCWLKTPGVCSIKDDYEFILKKIIHADQLWVISDTAWGFLDHKGKNIYDRILPVATMYLKFSGKQMRHIMRYKQKTDIGIIYTGDGDREYLERWNKRAALNFGSRSLGAFPVETMKEAIACM